MMDTKTYNLCKAALDGLEAAVRKAISELDIIDARERLDGWTDR